MREASQPGDADIALLDATQRFLNQCANQYKSQFLNYAANTMLMKMLGHSLSADAIMYLFLTCCL